MVDIFKYAAVLASVSCLAVLPVSLVHQKTDWRAADGRDVLLTAALGEVAPGFAAPLRKTAILQGEPDSMTYWVSASGGDTTYSFTIETFRYPGNDLFVVGIGADGIVKGMCAVGGTGSHYSGAAQKTGVPQGLIAKKGKMRPPQFTDQFAGLSVSRPITVSRLTYEWPRLDEGGRRTLLEKNEIAAIPGAIGPARNIANAVTAKARRLLKAIRS